MIPYSLQAVQCLTLDISQTTWSQCRDIQELLLYGNSYICFVHIGTVVKSGIIHASCICP